MSAFITRECAIAADKYVVGFSEEFYSTIGPLQKEKSSYYGILPRFFNLSPADYLRMCRDVYNGTLFGKVGGFIIVYFEKKDCERLVKELNARWRELNLY